MRLNLPQNVIAVGFSGVHAAASKLRRRCNISVEKNKKENSVPVRNKLTDMRKHQANIPYLRRGKICLVIFLPIFGPDGAVFINLTLSVRPKAVKENLYFLQRRQKPLYIQRFGKHRQMPILIKRPLLFRPVPIQFDAIPIRVV